MKEFIYHRSVQGRQYVNDVFMVVTELPVQNTAMYSRQKPIVIKAKTPAVFKNNLRLMRARQGATWNAGYGFRIKSLKI